MSQPPPPPTAPGAPQSASSPVPDRPVLAPNVQLCGELPASGFMDTLWLVQCDDKFLQLTDVLYRILEQANGQRTLDEIAAGVSAALGRGVSAASTRQLIATKLIPQGLVAKADSTVEVVPRSTGALHSPLAVNLRYRVVSAQRIEPIARGLQVLFTPPVLVVLLLLAAVSHGWVYFGHGVAESMQAVLATPALLLLLLPLSIVSSIFHEFGHAAALRYGGGRASGIGVGFYLSYPVFYADVTDSYRLGRWARVRTDLGGLYFNLIFELGLLALYFLTGRDFFVLAVVVLDLAILDELMPYARFDGYWALADLTGIPDFFALMGPFVRSVVPVPWWQGPRLPQLKGWVKLVFGVYILVTIPLLNYLLWLMLKNVPRMVVVMWQGMVQQTAAFVTAQGAGELLGMAVASVNMLTLALTTFGLLLLLFNVGYQAFSALRRWSKPTPLRRRIELQWRPIAGLLGLCLLSLFIGIAVRGIIAGKASGSFGTEPAGRGISLAETPTLSVEEALVPSRSPTSREVPSAMPTTAPTPTFLPPAATPSPMPPPKSGLHSVTTTTGLDARYQPRDRTSTFTPTEQVYISYQISAAQAGEVVTFKCMFNDVVWWEGVNYIAGGDTYTGYFVLEPLPPGTYRGELAYNGELQTVSWEVR